MHLKDNNYVTQAYMFVKNKNEKTEKSQLNDI